MSFPNHDPYWCDVAAFVEAHRRPGEAILAPDLFWWRFGDIYRYAHLHLDPGFTYDWVVIHKGELGCCPLDFLHTLPERYHPVFANAVFVVWRSEPTPAVVSDGPHLAAFAERLKERAELPYTPQPPGSAVFPFPGRILRFDQLDKAGLARAMDAFYAHGGYEYPTLRDGVFFGEIDRWIRVLWDGLEDAAALDVGCGDGRVARAVDRYRSLLEVDISQTAVAMARAAAADDRRRCAAVMDAEALALGDGGFDAVTLIEGIEHVHDAAAALAEAARVLRPGGAIILNCANAHSLHQRLNRALGHPYFVTNYQHMREFSFPEVRAMLDAVGIRVDRAEGIFLYPYWGVPAVDQHVRGVTDDDPELVETLRILGERAGPELAYCFILRGRKVPG